MKTTRREFMKQLTGLGVAIAAGVKVTKPLQMGGDAPRGAMTAEFPPVSAVSQWEGGGELATTTTTSPSDVTVKWTDCSWTVVDNPKIDKDGNLTYTGHFVNH